MPNRRTAALEYIKRHWAERGCGPPVQGLANALGTSKARAARILERLEADGLIIRKRAAPGKRGEILLPDLGDQVSVGDALRVLRRASEAMDQEALRQLVGSWVLPVTDTHLSMPAALDYLPDVEDGGLAHGHDGAAGNSR